MITNRKTSYRDNSPVYTYVHMHIQVCTYIRTYITRYILMYVYYEHTYVVSTGVPYCTCTLTFRYNGLDMVSLRTHDAVSVARFHSNLCPSVCIPPFQEPPQEKHGCKHQYGDNQSQTKNRDDRCHYDNGSLYSQAIIS